MATSCTQWHAVVFKYKFIPTGICNYR